jgi:hypothetical protein
MASQGWKKNKKGYMEKDGATRRQMMAEKRAAGGEYGLSDTLKGESPGAIDPKWGTSNVERMGDRVAFEKYDIPTIEGARGKVTPEIESLARDIADGKADILNPVVVEKVGFEKYRLISGEREFLASKRAKELNPEIETVNGYFVRDPKAARTQLKLFADVKIPNNATGEAAKIDISMISTKVKADTKPLEKQARSILGTGDNLKPVILRKVGFEKYEVVAGHQVYHAAVRAKSKDRKFETMNAIVLDN